MAVDVDRKSWWEMGLYEETEPAFRTSSAASVRRLRKQHLRHVIAHPEDISGDGAAVGPFGPFHERRFVGAPKEVRYEYVRQTMRARRRCAS